MNTVELKDAFTVLAGALGVLAFLWRLWDTLISHVRLSVDITSVEPNTAGDSGKTAIVCVAIENQGITPKRVAYVALLIGPSNLTVDHLALAILQSSSNAPRTSSSKPLIDLYRLELDSRAHSPDGEVHLVPLPFFYLDHSQVGNEQLRFKRNLTDLHLRMSEEHRLFLLVFSREPLGIIRCRMTSDLLPRQLTQPSKTGGGGDDPCPLHLTA